MMLKLAALQLPRTWVVPTLTEHGPLAALAHATAARYRPSRRSCRSPLAASRTRPPAPSERDAVTYRLAPVPMARAGSRGAIGSWFGAPALRVIIVDRRSPRRRGGPGRAP